MMSRMLICLLALAVTPLAQAQEGNLLANAGFEEGAEGWQFDEAVSQLVADARTGAQALRLDCPAEAHHVSAGQVIACEPGKRYLLSAWSKGEAKVSLLGWFKDAEGKDLPGPRPYVVVGGPIGLHGWSQTAMIVEPPPICAQLKAILYVQQGHAIFDDVELTVTEQTDNLLFNGGMEVCTLPDVPDGWWRTLRGPDPHPPSVNAPGRWGVERESPWEGECCLKSDIPNSDMRSIIGPCQGGRPHTFSVYLRADRPMQVSAYIWWGDYTDTTWEVGTEWKRYTLTVEIPEGFSQARVSIKHLPVEGTLWADAAQLEVGDTATPFRASLRDLPRAPVTEPAQVAVEIPAAALDLVRGPVPGPHAEPGVNVDPAWECLSVDGKPFFGVGFGGVPLEQLGELEGMNCNIVTPRGIFGEGAEEFDVAKSLEHARACLDRAEELNLKVIMWPRLLGDKEYEQWYQDETRRGWLEGVIAGLKDHPALLAWMTTDEPHTVPAEWIERLHNFFRERDPAHPAFINLGCGKSTAGCIESYGPFTDLVSVDYYPAAREASLEGIADYAELVRAAQPGKPLHYWVQCFTGPYWYRYPTPAEETAMDYLAIIHGTTLISYFIYRPTSEVLWQHVRDLNAELRSLADEHGLLRPPAPSDQTVIVSDGVHVLVKGDAERVMLVTVNARARPAQVHFSVPGLAADDEVRVAFEDRTIEHATGGFDDHYDATSRHVYLIN